MNRAAINKLVKYLLLCLVGLIIVYPLLWLFFSSFKPNEEILSGTRLLPTRIVWDSYVNGWKGSGQYTFGTYFINTALMVFPTVLFTILSSTLVGYGFGRFDFPFKKVLFMIMMSTLMLPNAVIVVPRFILFRNLGWIDTYLPFIVPSIFACYPFFIFLMVQFLRGLPRELDQSAIVDGCNPFQILMKILLPLCKPALFSMGIFQFIWTWNDFFNVLIYINSVRKYTLALGLRMTLDVVGATHWNEIMAMSIVTMLPCILIFFFAQKYFVEGIATTGIKG